MARFDEYIVYVDESGDHGLSSVDPNYPIFVLAFCIFRKTRYAEEITTQITSLKFRHFGHDQVILHERDIRKQKGPFQILFDEATRSAFLNDISSIVEAAPFTLIASAIDKEALLHRSSSPENPYHLALGFGLESIYRHLHEEKECEEGTLHVVFEERGRKEDNTLELEFRRLLSKNRLSTSLPFEIIFSNKKSNSAGLQLADLIARPIGRYLLDPSQPNRAYSVLQSKFRQSPSGDIREWGLHLFPH